MANSTSVRLYFTGKTPEDAVKNVEGVALEEKVAQELVREDENVYAIDVTIFSSRLKDVDKWT